MVGEDPDGFSSLVALLSSRAGMPGITDALTYADWQKSRAVYEFDPDFACELASSDGLMGLSIADLAQRRPARCLYICAPLPDHQSAARGTVKQAGFFSDIIDLPVMRGSTPQMVPQLVITTIDSAGAMVDMHALSLDLATFQDMFDEEVEALKAHGFTPGGAATVDINGRHVGTNDVTPEVEQASLEGASKTIQMALACLAYLGSYEPEIVKTEATPRLKRPTKSGYSGQAPRLVVGSAIGGAIRRYEAQQTSSSEPIGVTMRPHLRRAHWSHYWVGPRGSSERHVEPRWLSPILVNADLGDIPTTVHRVV